MFWTACTPDPTPRTWRTALTDERLMHLRGTGAAPWVAGNVLWEQASGLFRAVGGDQGWRGISVDSTGVWAVGTGGKAARFANGTWTHETFGPHDGIGIAAWGDEVWVPTGLGEIQRRENGSWRTWTPPALAQRNTGMIWGSSPTDVWLHATPRGSGIPPELGHWDGSQWTFEALSSKGYLSSIAGTGSDDVWAAGWTVQMFGKGPLLAHWDGTAWMELEVPAPHKLLDVFPVSRDEIWACGEGVLLHGTRAEDGTWTFTPQQVPDDGPLIGVWATPTSVWTATTRTLYQSPV